MCTTLALCEALAAQASAAVAADITPAIITIRYYLLNSGAIRLKILVASKIDPTALAWLRSNHDTLVMPSSPAATLSQLIADRDVLIFRSGVELPREVLDRAPGLRLLIRAGSGLDNIDSDVLQTRGIRLLRIPGPGAQSVAELSFALMLALARRLREADESMRAGLWLKSQLEGRTLADKTLGIVGLGNIGSRTANMGVAWGMRVVGCVARPTSARATDFAGRSIQLAGLDDVLSQSDFVSIHVPRSPETIDLIGERELGLMRPTAILVNVARGGIVNEGSLRAALVEGRLAGAGLDVHVAEGDGLRSPLADLPNVLLTPHVGATTLDAQSAIGEEIVRIVTEAAGEIDATPVPQITEPTDSTPAVAG